MSRRFAAWCWRRTASLPGGTHSIWRWRAAALLLGLPAALLLGCPPASSTPSASLLLRCAARPLACPPLYCL
eukprot:5994004-Alexandrium_andersonii.AAC.1